MSLDLSIPDSQKSVVIEAFKDAYQKWRVRNEEIQKEWTELEPILKSLGIIEDKAPREKTLSELVQEMQGDGRIIEQSDQEDVESRTVDTPAGFVHSEKYDINWKWLRKIEYILEGVGVAMTSNEIIAQVLLFEPHYTEKILLNSIPATLSMAARAGKIKRQKNQAKKEYEYSLDNGPY